MNVTNADVLALLKRNGDAGTCVRDVQNELKLSAKTARQALQKLGKQINKGEYRGFYVLVEDEELEKRVKSLATTNERYEEIREQILQWMYDGNVDVEAWANDPEKRPPSHFIRMD